jgi:AcrR family transcriptional regulator
MLVAALDLFGTKGYSATTVDEVARRAHVSTRNFYEQFENRMALLQAVGERIAATVFTAWTTAQVPSGGRSGGRVVVARRLRARVAALVHALVDDPRVARVAFVETLAIDPVDGARRREALRIFPDWIRRFLDGHFERLGIAEHRRDTLAIGVFGACYELIAEWVRREHIAEGGDAGSGDAGGESGGTGPSVDELIDEVVELATVILRLPRLEDAPS